MRMIQRLALLAALAAVCSAAAAQNVPYRFEPLGERPRSASSGDLVRRLPALNDSGTAAFVIGPATGWYGETLYTGTPGNVRQVETPSVSVGGGVSINNHGRIGFHGLETVQGIPGMYAVTAGGPVILISRGSFDFAVPTGNLETAISDSGAVMALADQPQRFPSSVIIGDGTGPAQRVFSTSPRLPQSVSGPVMLRSPRMSAGGDWTAFEIEGGAVGYTAVNSSRGSRDTAFGFWRSVGSSDVAGDGVVVFQGARESGTLALFTFRDDSSNQIVSGSEALPPGTVAMNDVGTIALLEGQSEGAGTRLWLLRNGVAETVLSAGDPLLGSTVSTIGFDPKGFNNSEQFALLVGLTDGRDVFVLASPVPEPGAIGLACGAALLLLRRREG
jgi:hypothetical protein